MKVKHIDINCDVGEGIGNEAQLFPYISSCNIACGGHAGDEKTMHKVALLAKEHKIKVGAHPSYPDKENFGRVVLKMPKRELIRSIQQQIKAFLKVIESEGLLINHIKPHGALYNEIAKNSDEAETFLEAIQQFKKDVILYVPFNSVIAKKAKTQGYTIKYEAFCDRNYNDDLTLVSRKKNNALITDSEDTLNHILQMAAENSVKTVSGKLKKIKADTFCIHGDTPKAVEILTYLSKELPKKGIYITK
jgi:UPF0271 protein